MSSYHPHLTFLKLLFTDQIIGMASHLKLTMHVPVGCTLPRPSIFGPHELVPIFGPHELVPIFGPYELVPIFGPYELITTFGPYESITIFGPYFRNIFSILFLIL